jgi:type IV pilus assembly protein PilC
MAVMVVAFVVVAVIMIFRDPGLQGRLQELRRRPARADAVRDRDVRLLRLVLVPIFGLPSAGIWYFFFTWKRSEKMQIAMDRLFLRLPVFGDLINKATIARWTRTLSTMFAAGVPLVEALDSVAAPRATPSTREATEQIQPRSTGTSLTTSMTERRRLPEHGAADDGHRRGVRLARRCCPRPPTSTSARSTSRSGAVEPDGADHHRRPRRG